MSKKSTNREELFRSAPISKAVWGLCLPNILSMLTGVIYNLVDMFFIGRIGDPNQLAAVSLSGPIFTILMGFGNIFGLGGGAFLARSMGEGKHDRVKQISSFCFWTAIGLGVVSAAAIMGGMEPLLDLVGTSENTRTFTRQYLSWIGMGAPIMVLNYVGSNLIRSEGGAKETMLGQMLGTVVNIILDPILIFGLKMGVQGAAAATVFGNFCSVAYFCVLLIRSKTQSLSPRHYRVKKIIGPVMVVGVPASLNNVMMSIATLIMNNKLVRYGDEVIAGMGVAAKVNSIAFILLIAIAFGVQPLLAYNYGARNRDRFHGALRYTAMLQIIVGTAGMLLIETLAGPLVRFFIDDPAVIQNGTYILRAMSATGPVVGMLFLMTNLFQAMGKGVPSMILSLSRSGFVYIPVLLVMSALFAKPGTIWSQPVSDVIALAIAFIMYKISMKNDKEMQ
ncbi:MAG: MATE family efflux transporter [Clostridiales bacterium]|nr:MATE family efflux transporter [Clostridiales bacterium]